MRRDKQEAPRYRGAFLLASLLHFCSGQLLHNLSGVDTIELVDLIDAGEAGNVWGHFREIRGPRILSSLVDLEPLHWP